MTAVSLQCAYYILAELVTAFDVEAPHVALGSRRPAQSKAQMASEWTKAPVIQGSHADKLAT